MQSDGAALLSSSKNFTQSLKVPVNFDSCACNKLPIFVSSLPASFTEWFLTIALDIFLCSSSSSACSSAPRLLTPTGRPRDGLDGSSSTINATVNTDGLAGCNHIFAGAAKFKSSNPSSSSRCHSFRHSFALHAGSSIFSLASDSRFLGGKADLD